MHHRRLSLCWIYESFPGSHRTRFIRCLRVVQHINSLSGVWTSITCSTCLCNSDARTELLQSLIHSLATKSLPRMHIIATDVHHNVNINVLCTSYPSGDDLHYANPSTWYRSILLLTTNASRLPMLWPQPPLSFEYRWSNNLSLCKHA